MQEKLITLFYTGRWHRQVEEEEDFFSRLKEELKGKINNRKDKILTRVLLDGLYVRAIMLDRGK